ncbi:MAG: phosphoglycolate phosphatase [Rhizobiaceae bacterium]|nr:phosphoglycolate phosphatase [Rhizobiaceae bacterium]
MTTTPRLVIFDLDGTLVDSNRDLIPALNKATATEGLPHISMEDVGHVVGKGALQMIERAFHFHGRELEVGGAIHKHLLDRFVEFYEQNLSDETVFFPGTLKALDKLSEDSWQLAVCTNKYERLARKLLEQLGEANRFPVITGGDTFEVKKPDPQHLIETANLANVSPEHCIMVGDSVNDIAAAQTANMPVIAVDFGYSDVPVEELNPDRIISHFDELGAAVSDLSKS